MIDTLFGSKTRVKLLHLFLNNPGKAFYVREITRLIDEQINSVRRELSNMLEVGIITSTSTDNKLYYEVNQRYEHFAPLRQIFTDQKSDVVPVDKRKASTKDVAWQRAFADLTGVRIAVVAGALVSGSASSVDVLIAGNVVSKKVASLIASLESSLGRELTYSLLTYDEFYYRLSVRDKFITSILASKHMVIVDTESILKV